MDAPTTPEEGRTILDALLGITLNLVRVDNPERPTEPIGLASGFVIEKEGKLYLLTAGHAAMNNPWFWECPLDLAEGCLLVPVGPFIRYARASLLNGGLTIDESKVPAADFAWAPFDPAAIGKKLNSFSGPKEEINFELYRGRLDATLAPGEVCVLATRSRGLIEKARLTYLHRDFCVQDLEYRHTNEKGHHVFAPVGGHQGHDYYKGASGAPIANGDGVIVSMLIGAAIPATRSTASHCR